MDWFAGGPGSADDSVVSAEVFTHQVTAQGKCTMCGNDFLVVFRKHRPNDVFHPKPQFDCPCGHFSYDPDDHSVKTKDTHLRPEELRKVYDAATLEKSA